MISNFPDGFKTVRIFFQMTANFPDDFKTVRIFQMIANFPDHFQFLLRGEGYRKISAKRKLRQKRYSLSKTPLFHIFQPFLVHFNVHFGPFLALWVKFADFPLSEWGGGPKDVHYAFFGNV